MAEEEDKDAKEIEEAEETTEENIAESVEEAVETKKKKVKKVVRRRKSKKEKEKPLTAAIRLAVESGKVAFGARRSVSASLLGKAKLFVMATNTPDEIRERVVKYSTVSNIPMLMFEGTSIELGSVCGKPFPISVLSIYDPGSSPILELAAK